MKVILLQTVLVDYRRDVLQRIISLLGADFHIFTGLEYFDSSLKTNVNLGQNQSPLRNNFFFGRRLLFQTGMWKPVLKADVVIFEMNPRIVSNWPLLLIRKFLGRRNVLWGHAWPRRGRLSRTSQARHLLWLLGDVVVVYTETQAKEVAEAAPHRRVIAAPNALYSKDVMNAESDCAKLKNIIYVGRLVRAKKPGLLIDAFVRAAKGLPPDSQLLLVGDGPLASDLKREAALTDLAERIIFKGHVADLNQLRELYGQSLVSVSPGYVGLSITQSFAFGVPMLIARDEPHSPEIEAARQGENCEYFESDSVGELAQVLIDFYRNARAWCAKRKGIAASCAEQYSAEHMADRIIEAVRGSY